MLPLLNIGNIPEFAENVYMQFPAVVKEFGNPEKTEFNTSYMQRYREVEKKYQYISSQKLFLADQPRLPTCNIDAVLPATRTSWSCGLICHL